MHPEIAQLILNTPTLKAKVELDPNGVFNIESAHQIRSTEVRFNRHVRLQKFTRRFISLGPIILANPELIQKIEELQLHKNEIIENYSNIYIAALELAKEMYSTKSTRPSQ